jgi:hypothetical protein
MTWKNKATTKSLRLGKQDGDIYHEISPHILFMGLCLDTEDVKQGQRLSIIKATPKELLKQFPDLKEWETLLYAYEEIAKFRGEAYKNNYALAQEIESTIKDHNSKKEESFSKHFLEGYLKGLQFKRVGGGLNDNL